jgi:drug/metabolite transporter (DMT)-like permease
MTRQNKSYLLALISILFWSTAGTAFKLSLREIDFISILLIANLTSLFIYAFSLSYQNKWHQILKSKKKDIFKSAVNGFLNPFLYYFILFQAYDLLLAQEALTLNYLWPIVLIVLSIPLLKQKIGFVSILAVIVSFFGSYIIATGGKIFSLEFTNLYGVFLALISCFAWALFWIQNIKDQRDELQKLFLNFCFGLLYTIIAIIFIGGFSMPSMNGIFGGIYIGFFEMGITFILWLKALKLSETTAKVSNLIYLAPFISLIIISIVLKESILFSTFIGLLFIISGIILQKFSNKLSFRKSV